METIKSNSINANLLNANPLEAVNGKPVGALITQKQLAMCEGALNIAALQLEASAQIAHGNKAISLANDLARSAALYRQMAQAINCGAIVGSGGIIKP